jgi:hypothetical protein
LDLVTTSRLRAHPHETFRRALLGLEVKETVAGWRVDHRPSAHDDSVVAVALAIAGLPACRAADLLVWADGDPAVAREQLAQRSRTAVIESWDAKSIRVWDGRASETGGRNGLAF